VDNASAIWSCMSNRHAALPSFGDMMKSSKKYQLELSTMGNAVIAITVWQFLTSLKAAIAGPVHSGLSSETRSLVAPTELTSCLFAGESPK
jgi:hypothetical protein